MPEGAPTDRGERRWSVVSRDPVEGETGPVGIPDGLSEVATGEIVDALTALEDRYRTVVGAEFDDLGGLVEAGPADLTGRAAVRLAVALTTTGPCLSRAEAVSMVRPSHVESLLHGRFGRRRTVELARGIGVSPGAAVGSAYFTADGALEAYDRGEAVVLVVADTGAADVPGIAVASGIVSATGGVASHAAVVARGWGKPAVAGATSISLAEGFFTANGVRVHEGETISVDGTEGAVYLGGIPITETDAPPELDTILEWADALRGDRLEVRANADSPEDVRKGFEMGAAGVGLYRSENVFLGLGLSGIRDYILAEDEGEAALALAGLADAQRAHLIEILEATGGRPVGVRLLDPPLHEFLPSPGEDPTLSERQDAIVDFWREKNPMLGVRGVRLGVVVSELYRMQIGALVDAVIASVEAGGRPRVDLMVPLVVDRAEVELISGMLESEAERGEERAAAAEAIRVGAVIETPRAALMAASIAEVVGFFSFGTNDLTQMTFGFSRDDIEAKFMRQYLESRLLPSNPFETIDQGGVVELMRGALRRGREANPHLEAGVCGEHGGDPASIDIFVGLGVDHVSCSPYRIPIARLAGAHAVLARSGGSIPDDISGSF